MERLSYTLQILHLRRASETAAVHWTQKSRTKQQDLHDSNSQVEMKVLQNTAEVKFTRQNLKSTAFLSLGGRGVAEHNTNLQ